MNEMIEKVAKAIHAESIRFAPTAEGGYEFDSEPWHSSAMRAARAAIAAMREPTKEMIIDGLFGIQTNMDSTRDSNSSWDFAVEGTAYHCWVDMIDAALKNDTPPTPKTQASSI